MRKYARKFGFAGTGKADVIDEAGNIIIPNICGGTAMQSKSNVKVTIIVPVHNSEKYLQQCMESAVSQTLRDIEVLCIDSGSTDRCCQIISKIKEQDNRIVYVKDPNSSYGYKINLGIEMAKGDYIAILETDDRMPPEMMEKLYSIGELHHVDVVNSDYYEFFEFNNKIFRNKREIYPSFQVYDQLINYTTQTPKTIVAEGIWTALYRKEFFLTQNIRLNESPGASYQDASFLFLRSLLARSVYHLDEPLYWYRVDNVGSSVKDDKKIFEIADEYIFLKRELEKRNVKDIGVWNLFYYKKFDAFYGNCLRLSEKSRELFLQRYLEELRDAIAVGAISREMCDEGLYRRTFHLLDDLEKFKETVDKESQQGSFMTMPETLNRLESRDVVVFGAGILGRRVIDILQQNENRIMSICDNAEKLHGTTLAGLEVGSVTETVKRFPNACYLIVNRKHSEEMKAQLLAEGIPEKDIEVFK